MTHARRVLFLIALFPGIASAQVVTGTPPFGSFGGGPDIINLANLNAHITIPVLHKAGRGLDFNFDITYDTSVWQPVGSSGSQTWVHQSSWGLDGSDIRIGYVTYAIVSRSSGCGTTGNRGFIITRTYTSWTYHDGFGTPHAFPGTSSVTTDTCTGTTTTTGFTATASDGSGYNISVDGATVTRLLSRDGNVINALSTSGFPASVGSVEDRNGNEISENSSGVFTDTLGTTALTIAGTAPSNTTFTYTAPSNTSAAYTVSYKTYTVKTNFGCSRGR